MIFFLTLFDWLASYECVNMSSRCEASMDPVRVKSKSILTIYRICTSREEFDWYNIDVASMLSHIQLLGHEINESDGSSLLFLEKSAILCSPEESAIHHFPKNMLHCFVDDFRRLGSQDDGILFKVELFSISPSQEQLCWERCCRSELEVPSLQSAVSKWLWWLNS